MQPQHSCDKSRDLKKIFPSPPVIGLGNIGGQVATALIEASQPIMVVDHGSGKAQARAICRRASIPSGSGCCGDLVPNTAITGVLFNPNSPAADFELRDIPDAAHALADVFRQAGA
jgi:hypothetical protein